MPNKVYIGAFSGNYDVQGNGVTCPANKIYVSVNGQLREVTKGYIGVNGEPKVIFDRTSNITVTVLGTQYTISGNTTIKEFFDTHTELGYKLYFLCPYYDNVGIKVFDGSFFVGSAYNPDPEYPNYYKVTKLLIYVPATDSYGQICANVSPIHGYYDDHSNCLGFNRILNDGDVIIADDERDVHGQLMEYNSNNSIINMFDAYGIRDPEYHYSYKAVETFYCTSDYTITTLRDFIKRLVKGTYSDSSKDYLKLYSIEWSGGYNYILTFENLEVEEYRGGYRVIFHVPMFVDTSNVGKTAPEFVGDIDNYYGMYNDYNFLNTNISNKSIVSWYTRQRPHGETGGDSNANWFTNMYSTTPITLNDMTHLIKEGYI